MGSCKSPCDSPASRPSCTVECLTPTQWRIIVRSGAIVATTGADVIVQFPCVGRVYSVRGAAIALGGHANLDAALMSIRAGWSKDAKDPAIRQNDGLASGDASLMTLFGRDVSREELLTEDGQDGVCIGNNTKLFVQFSDANGDDGSEAELMFYFEPAS